MSDPKVAGTAPVVLQLDQGTYYWCACGQSKNQPWCDGSHRPEDPQPIAFTASVLAPDSNKQGGTGQTLQSDHLLCGCKYSASPPFCDGSHIHTIDGYEE